MAATLETLIDQTAQYAKIDLEDDEDDLEGRIVSALNEAKNLMARRYFPLYATEDITLDADSSFAVTDTAQTYYRVSSVTYAGRDAATEQREGRVYCEAPAGATVSVKYQYIPADMTQATDTLPFPDIVDYHVLCFRAAQTCYEIKGTSSARQKAALWESRWQEAVGSLFAADDPGTVRDVYSFDESVW